MSKQIFITYSWDSEPHKNWVRKLTDKLIENGLEVQLDQYDLTPGESFTHFMEKSIEQTDKVIVILTPNYRQKSISRDGGVGYEQQIISGEIMSGIERKKFIPIIVRGTYENGDDCAIPAHFKGIYALDFRDSATFEQSFETLLRSIYEKPKFVKPIKGLLPDFVNEKKTRFEIKLNKDFENTQSKIILTDIFNQIIDLRRNQKSYEIQFSIENLSDIVVKHQELQEKSEATEQELKQKLAYREFLNSHFYWGEKNLYNKLQEVIENVIDYSYTDYIYNLENLTTTICNCFKLFSDYAIRTVESRGFDVFIDEKNWSFKVYLPKEEVTQLISSFGVKEPSDKKHDMLLTRFGGLTTFDLSNEILISNLLPKQHYSFIYKEFHGKIKPDEKEDFFKTYNWKIGLG